MWQFVEVEGEFSAARGRQMKTIPPMSGWAALLQAKALLAKLAAQEKKKLLAMVALRMPASKALSWAEEAHPASPTIGPTLAG